jgi:hypothetical protein
MRKQRLVILGVTGIIAATMAFVVLGGDDGRLGQSDDFKLLNDGGLLAGYDNPDEGGSTVEAQSGNTPAGTPIPQPLDSEEYRADDAAGVGGAVPVGTGAVGELPQAQVLERKIVRNATMDTTVEDVPAAVRSVETRALAAGGFVSASNVFIEAPPEPLPVAEGEPVPTPAPERQRANVQIRVPAESYTAVMSDLRALGDVKLESSTTSEVTEQYTDLEARLRNLQASEQQYLDLLGRAAEIPDIITVQDRLNAVRLEVEQVQGQLQLLDDLTDLATIDINISLPPLVVEIEPVEAEAGWAQEAWENAWEKSQQILEIAGAVAITAGIVLIWILVPAILLGLGWRVATAIGRRGASPS